MDIRPIKNDDDHRSALKEIEALWNAEAGTEAADKLDILAILVERYEQSRWPIDTANVDPVDILSYLIEDGGRTQAELGDLLGSRSRASEILNRKRPLNLEMIRKICEAWKVPAAILIVPYRTEAAA